MALCENRGWIGGRPFNANLHSLCQKQCSQTIRFGLKFRERCSTTTQWYGPHLVVRFQSQYSIPISTMRWESQLPNTRRGCQASSNLSMNAAAQYPNISYFSLSTRMIMLAEACERDEILFTFLLRHTH